jgi:hypothetical protein
MGYRSLTCLPYYSQTPPFPLSFLCLFNIPRALIRDELLYFYVLAGVYYWEKSYHLLSVGAGGSARPSTVLSSAAWHLKRVWDDIH